MYMKRAIVTAVVVFVSSLSLAQGPPASVTSIGFGGHGGGGGVPASVTSPGFGNFGGNHTRLFSSPPCCANRGNQFGRHHHQVSSFPFAGPVYAVPYYVPYAVDVVEPVDDSLAQPQPDPYLGGPTIFDRRGPGMQVQTQPAPVAAPASRTEQVAEASPEPGPAPSIVPAPDRPETVLVFRDGHKLEVKNYAILGDTLYDMTPDHRHKITLAELDLDATVRQNDERGIDFRLPIRPQAN
jgi:hypothetical protein